MLGGVPLVVCGGVCVGWLGGGVCVCGGVCFCPPELTTNKTTKILMLVALVAAVIDGQFYFSF